MATITVKVMVLITVKLPVSVLVPSCTGGMLKSTAYMCMGVTCAWVYGWPVEVQRVEEAVGSRSDAARGRGDGAVPAYGSRSHWGHDGVRRGTAAVSRRAGVPVGRRMSLAGNVGESCVCE